MVINLEQTTGLSNLAAGPPKIVVIYFFLNWKRQAPCLLTCFTHRPDPHTLIDEVDYLWRDKAPLYPADSDGVPPPIQSLQFELVESSHEPHDRSHRSIDLVESSG